MKDKCPEYCLVLGIPIGTALQNIQLVGKEGGAPRTTWPNAAPQQLLHVYETAMHFVKKYRLTMVGTIVPASKKTHEDHAILFLKLSNVSYNGMERCWFCEACLKLQADWMLYYIQCTSWKDKNRYHFFQSTMWDGVMVSQYRGTYEANIHIILSWLHEHKLIMFQITMPWTEMIRIAQTS
jgi:hypothetical protein